MGKWCLHASLFIFDRIIIKVVGSQDRHKSSVEFDFGPDQTTHFGVTCPWVTKISRFWTLISLKPVGQSWSNFMCIITGVGERLHKVLRQIGSLRWAIVALWATCFIYLHLVVLLLIFSGVQSMIDCVEKLVSGCVSVARVPVLYELQHHLLPVRDVCNYTLSSAGQYDPLYPVSQCTMEFSDGIEAALEDIYFRR